MLYHKETNSKYYSIVGRRWNRAKLKNQYNDENELDVVPMNEEELTVNIGIPIAFVLTKSDIAVDELENYLSLHGLNIDLLDYYQNFILFKLRVLALNYGASLFITSTTKNTNIDSLREFLSNFFGESIESHTFPPSIPNSFKINEISKDINNYEDAYIHFGEDSLEQIMQLNLDSFFSLNSEALPVDVKELIPEEPELLVDFEHYGNLPKDSDEYVEVIDHQTFLTKQAKTQTFQKSKSSTNFTRNDLDSLDSTSDNKNLLLGSQNLNRISTSYPKAANNSNQRDNKGNLIPSLDGPTILISDTVSSLSPSASITTVDTKLEEEAEDFFNNMLKKIKKK
jgi:hypothetical protein